MWQKQSCLSNHFQICSRNQPLLSNEGTFLLKKITGTMWFKKNNQAISLFLLKIETSINLTSSRQRWKDDGKKGWQWNGLKVLLNTEANRTCSHSSLNKYLYMNSFSWQKRESATNSTHKTSVSDVSLSSWQWKEKMSLKSFIINYNTITPALVHCC